NILIKRRHKGVNKRLDIHLFVVARHNYRNGIAKLRMRYQIFQRTSCGPWFSRPKIQGSTQLPQCGRLFNQVCFGLYPWQKTAWEMRVNDVVRNYVDVGESLMRSQSHELVLSHSNLAARIPEPPPEPWNQVLDENLRIPKIVLEKEYLPSRLKAAMNCLQVS